MKIAIASDHGGYKLKEYIKTLLKDHDVTDLGTDSEDSVDYPDYGVKVAEAVAKGKFERGILICGTGLGMSMVANKVPGIRATLCHDKFTAKMSRKHNNSNILVMGGRVLNNDQAKEVVETWLNTDFEGDRHQRRLDKITKIEKRYTR